MSSLDELLTDFSWDSPPATRAQLADVEAALGLKVPQDLADFLTSRGTGEGFVGGGGYVAIRGPVEDWIHRHEILQAATRWPGLFIFGGDGGNELFGFDQDTHQYVEVDAIGDDNRRPLGRSFLEFLNAVSSWFKDSPDDASGSS